jgi:hypothetical protein
VLGGPFERGCHRWLGRNFKTQAEPSTGAAREAPPGRTDPVP